MSDIVERLRVNMHAYGIAQEAAYEIERLRAEVVHWKEARQMALDGGDLLKQEVDRLRAEVATYKAAAEAAEANLEREFSAHQVTEANLESALFIFQDVRAERDRLRELLRSLRSVVFEDYRHLIDAALKE